MTTGVNHSASVGGVPETSPPAFTEWSSFPFEGDLRVKKLDDPVAVEPPRKGEDAADCAKCHSPDDAYIWVSENWRVRSMDRPSGLPMVLILEARSHLDLGDLPNMLAAELGVMTVRLERAIRSLDGVARVHVNRWGDGAAHLHLWFMARPYGRLQLRGTFLTLWDEILPPVAESQWRENLAIIAEWLAEFGGEPLAKPPRIDWQAPSSFGTTQAMSPTLASPAGVAQVEAEQAAETPPAAPDPEQAESPGTKPESAAKQPDPEQPEGPGTQPDLKQADGPEQAGGAPNPETGSAEPETGSAEPAESKPTA